MTMRQRDRNDAAHHDNEPEKTSGILSWLIALVFKHRMAADEPLPKGYPFNPTEDEIAQELHQALDELETTDWKDFRPASVFFAELEAKELE